MRTKAGDLLKLNRIENKRHSNARQPSPPTQQLGLLLLLDNTQKTGPPDNRKQGKIYSAAGFHLSKKSFDESSINRYLCNYWATRNFVSGVRIRTVIVTTSPYDSHLSNFRFFGGILVRGIEE